MKFITVLLSGMPNLGNLWPYECNIIIGFLYWVVVIIDLANKKSYGEIKWRDGNSIWLRQLSNNADFQWFPDKLIENLILFNTFQLITLASFNLSRKWANTAPWEKPMIPSYCTDEAYNTFLIWSIYFKNYYFEYYEEKLGNHERCLPYIMSITFWSITKFYGAMYGPSKKKRSAYLEISFIKETACFFINYALVP
jgi:hypothetical protein